MIQYSITKTGKQRLNWKALTPLELKAHFAWSAARNRCRNKGCTAFEDYGGRGIRMDASWENSFEQFLADVGVPTESCLTLDRINNQGNYEPGNCRWVTHSENCRNRRDNRWIEIDGETKTLTEWAKIANLRVETLWRRLMKHKESGRMLLRPTSEGRYKNVRWITINGTTKNLSAWAKVAGISIQSMLWRINHGVTGEALIAPRSK